MHCILLNVFPPHQFAMCLFSTQANRLWDPPLLRPQHDGQRGSGDDDVP